MRLNQIADRPGARKRRMRIGRGIGSGMGKTGGRGGKGQTARAGYSNKGFEGGQMPLHRRLPKRGFRNTSFAVALNEINLGKIQAAIDAGRIDTAQPITAETLVRAGLLRRVKDGVKLLAAGEFRSKATFAVSRASRAAIAAVEKAGGSVTILAADRQAGAAGSAGRGNEPRARKSGKTDGRPAPAAQAEPGP
ncbi:MAG: 50S ribosomal protein L15 [Pseudolabrys sp.]|nr:50S ribosomal protein L15 [Pseudolabrys sp.]